MEIDDKDEDYDEENDDMEWMEEEEDEEAAFEHFREQFSMAFELAHIRKQDLDAMLSALKAILEAFPPGCTVAYKESDEDDAPIYKFDSSDVYELMRLCFTSEDMAVRAKTYMQAIADHISAKDLPPRVDRKLPF